MDKITWSHVTDLNSTCTENKTHKQQQKFVQKAKGTDIGILYLIVTVRLFKVDLEERIFKYVLQGQP